ncbi:MAG: hypothetical protein PHE29_14725, partial [Tissierellia bacterium]|nr:hypothetical protein [Tissierellia bacterium]
MNELKKIKLNRFDLIYVSSALPDTMIEKYFNNSYQFFPHQSQKYNRLLIEGLTKNGIRVNALSILPITRNITRKIIIDKNNTYQNKVLYSTMRLINIPIIKNLTIFFSILFILIKNNKETPVVIDLLNKTATIAVYIAKKVKKNYVIGLLTDIPSFNTDKYNDNLQLTKLQKKIFSSFDHFILLTNEMTKLHKKFENNHTIIEGICDETLEVTYLNKYEGCSCLYSGTLAKVYGIDNLIQAFMSKDLEKVNLYIYGEGDYREEIERVSLSHKNIIYKGSVSNKEIIIEQTKVNLLINPRPVEGMFTKYSFPSKIIE